MGESFLDYFHYFSNKTTFSGFPVYYYINETNKKISNLRTSLLACINCYNTTIENITLQNAGYGILLFLTKNVTIKDVVTKDSYVCLLVKNSSYIKVYDSVFDNFASISNTYSLSIEDTLMYNASLDLYSNLKVEIYNSTFMNTSTIFVHKTTKFKFESNILIKDDESTLVLMAFHINDLCVCNNYIENKNSLIFFSINNVENVNIINNTIIAEDTLILLVTF